MSNFNLPARPSLEQLQKQAKELLRDYRADDARAVARIGAGTKPVLADVQFVLAREHGFATWAALKRHLDVRSDPHGLSAAPPFYRIDWEENIIELRLPFDLKDWSKILEVVKESRITGIRAMGQMTDDVLVAVSNLEHVTHLNLDASDVTDAGLRHLAAMPQLQHLELTRCPITNAGLGVLGELRELRSFFLYHHSGVSDEGLAHLETCERLERVDLLGTNSGDVVLKALAEKPALRHLKTGNRVTNAGLELLHHFPVYKNWRGGQGKIGLMEFSAEPNHLLLRGTFTDEGVAKLVGLDGLFALNLDDRNLRVTAAGLKPLAKLPNLGWLGFDATDEAMPHIAAMPRLRMLMCQDTVSGDDGFVALSKSRSIEYIWGRRCYGLGGRGFRAIAGMPALRGLSVSCKNVDDGALSTLPSFPSLVEFMPMNVPDEGFRHVGKCARLEALWCMYCRETSDAATEQITGLSQLKTYYAGQTKITDRSLELLSAMASLEQLTFWNCAGVTDAGLKALAQLPGLRELRLESMANVTRAGIAAIPAAVRVNYSS